MTNTPTISIIAAIAENGVIGRDGDMPWRLSTDLKRFKALTLGHPVIMGRRTFDSIGRPLPGRLNIVITRDRDWQSDGVMAVGSLGAAIDLAAAHLERFEPDADTPDAEPPNKLFVIGGGQIYAEALALADELHITHVRAEIDGDTHFPPIDADVWDATRSQDVEAGARDTQPTRYTVYQRHGRGG